MTSHKIGLHWLREHPDNAMDFAHIEAMQYRSVKPFKPLWDNRNASADLVAAMPRDAYILARDHDLSEQKEGMWRDPEGHGIYHADEWADKVRNGQYHLPTDRSFFLGINEPDATNGDRDAIDRYTSAFLRRLQAHGLRGGAFNFSTGHPRTVDGTPHTSADYSVFERSHRAIVEGHHLAVAHIYGTGAVPCVPGHYDRLYSCTWTDVEWIIGEFGIDEHVLGGGPHVGFHGHYHRHPDEYCAWLDTAISGVEAGPQRIHSYQIFTYDFSHPWETFDTRIIRNALEQYHWMHARTAQTPQHTVNIPIVTVATPPADVVTVTSPPSTDSNWSKCREFVKRWEGGWADHPADIGGPTNKGVTMPTFRRWRTLQGMGEPSVDDLRNLSDDEADALYHALYWQASGADKLPYPQSLVMFDTAVLHGVEAAKWFSNRVGGDALGILGLRLLTNAGSVDRDPSQAAFWQGWRNRVMQLRAIVRKAEGLA